GYQLAAAWFANLAGVQFVNVPYKGQAQIMTDVIGGQLDMAVVDLGGAITLLKEGKIRAVAVTGETR
ncbi:MAG TPA: tripartite tricarboxylate transporter substrate binding protein, partial [Cupriavidus sp.]|nr:tripartite tricarboxylate transporter substrate binding protein [Cupriavidus sp.]